MLKFFIKVAVLAFALIFVFGMITDAAEISPAIDVLRNEASFIKCGITGTEIAFSVSDFKDALGDDFGYITVTKLPDKVAGLLKLAGVKVLEGQTITSGSLDLLRFVPAGTNDAPETISFSFVPSSKNWHNAEIECVITYLSTVNFAPVASGFEIVTIENVAAYSPINVYDPDGDSMTVTIKEFPENGCVAFDAVSKTVVYTPEAGYTGKDIFSYFATDVYGNKSSEAFVTVNISRSDSSLCFGDMSGNRLHYAAIKLSEKNVMTYSMKGGEYYFSPDKTVNRIDFTVMLMCASGLTNVPYNVKSSGFNDDGNMSSGRKSYLKSALELGIVEAGTEFRPFENITGTEAVKMVTSALNLEKGKNPAIESVLKQIGEKETVTKAEAAELLYNIYLYSE